MKYIAFIFLLFFLSCSNNQERFNLEGSWMTIEPDSTVNEVYYDDKTMQYFYGDGLNFLPEPVSYIIKNDTIIVYTRVFKNMKPLKHLLKKNNDTLVVYQNLKHKGYYIPISKSELTINKIKNNSDYKNFLKAHRKRKLKLKEKGYNIKF